MRKLNSEKHRKTAESGNTRRPERGNAMIYILVAIALIGFLTMTLARQNQQSDNQNLDDEQAELYAAQLISYAAAAKSVVDQMLMTGSTASDLDFVTPNQPSFELGSNVHKFYHPQGGGFTFKTPQIPPFFDCIATGGCADAYGWYVTSNTNVDWTKTTANDVVFSAFSIPEEVCSAINKKITGTESIPVVALLATKFITGADTEFDATDCASCEGYPSLCVTDAANWVFYNVIVGR